MNLMIVDDEVVAIQGLVDDVPWDRLNFEEILTANSYAQAVNLFRTKKVDILLCDIEMPVGNGIELVRWVRENYPKTVCIFLTCHDDFEFARRAIALECLGYILKPADTEEVVEYLLKAQEKIMRENQNQVYHDYGKMYIDQMKGEEHSGGQEAMERVETYIHEHIGEQMSIEMLAGVAYLSVTHLGRLFKKKHNMTVVDYIQEQRVMLARELLKDPKLTVSAVAAKTGYNNYSYFTKSFKKITGKTPREYRQLWEINYKKS